MTNSQSLTQQASRGAFWSLASNITVSAISFVGTAVLARMLEPKDFGLIGMAVLVTGVVQLFGNIGLGSALVQQKDVSEVDLSTVFWANMAAGVVLALLCVLISPLAVMFFREKAVMWILISLSITFVLSAICSVHTTLVYKRIQMKPLAAIEVGGRVLRIAVMLIAAFCGFTFWSIVIGMIVERFFKTIALFFRDAWRPSFVFSMPRFKEMFHYGRNILGTGFMGYFNQNMDFIVTGRVLGTSLLGFYQMSFNLPNLIRGYINDSIGAVAFPVFCKVQDNNELLAKGFLKIVKFVAIGTFPILFGLAFTARDFILVAYGVKWLPTVLPMQILCFGAALAAVNSVVVSLLSAKGRPDLGFKWGFVRLPATIIAILLGVRFGGIVGVAWGMTIVEVLATGMVYQMFRILNSGFSEYGKALLPATVASIVMVGALVVINRVFLVNEPAAWVRLGLEFTAGATVYIAAVFFGFKETFNDFFKAVKSVLGVT